MGAHSLMYLTGFMGPYFGTVHRAEVGGEVLHGKVQCNMGNGHMGTPSYTTESDTFPKPHWRVVKINFSDIETRRFSLHFYSEFLFTL